MSRREVIQPTVRGAAASLLMLIVAGSAQAAGGKIPIYEVPELIDQPGSYYLTRDLTYSGPDTAITIAASGVTLDLAGHTLTQLDPNAEAIDLFLTQTDIRIMNGRVQGGRNCVYLINFAGASFNVHVSDLLVGGCQADGIVVLGGYEVIVPAQIVVERNQVVAPGGRGIHVGWVHGGFVSRNTVRGAGGDGILIEASNGVMVDHNNATDNGEDGISIDYCTNSTFDWNHATGNAGYGLNFTVTSSAENTFSNTRSMTNVTGNLRRVSTYGARSLADNYNP